jgi:hypothetical protein
MITTARGVADYLFHYLHPDERDVWLATAPAYRTEAVLEAINGAMQEIHSIGPFWFARVSRGYTIEEPVDLTGITINEGDTTFALTVANGYAAWMKGCTIRLAGEQMDNEILDWASDVLTLVNPYTGSDTVAETATVWCDAIDLESDVIEVARPVQLVDIRELSPVPGLSSIRSHSTYNYLHTWGDYGYFPNQSTTRYRKESGLPYVYYIDGFYDSDAVPIQRVRVAPMPNEKNALRLRLKLAPPSFAGTDIWANYPTAEASTPADPGTLIPAPNNFIESLVLPVAKMRMTASPFFRNKDAIPEIKRQYEAALLLMRKNSPQADPGIRSRPAPG